MVNAETDYNKLELLPGAIKFHYHKNVVARAQLSIFC